MFDRFNESARRAMFFSRYEAGLLGASEIGSEHVLLGVLREGDRVSKELLSALGVSSNAIRSKYPAINSQISSSAEMPISENVKKVLAYTTQEAQSRGEIMVGPQHIVLGILRVPECRAARDLAEFGVTYHSADEALGPIAREMEGNDATLITLRASHYALLDQIADAMELPAGRRASRQGLALAIMDALASSPIAKQKFQSTEDLRAQITIALIERWPE